LISCDCKKGYIGSRCQFNDPCSDKRRCQPNGSCQPVVQMSIPEQVSFYCRCDTGFFGENCTEEVETNPCSSSPCLNNGICVNKNLTDSDSGLHKWDYTCIW
jgi:sushi, von Willebrand factor type A, EGF and pentraxin domain-containing protein 1